MSRKNDGGNSMPERGKRAQAVECLIDIRDRGGASSGIVVFDSGQLSGGNEQGPDFYRFQNNDEVRWLACAANCAASCPQKPHLKGSMSCELYDE